MSFMPLSSRVLTKPITSANTGRIVIPNAPATRARVLAVGPDARDVKEGDIIVLPVHGKQELELGGETFYLLFEKDIEGILS